MTALLLPLLLLTSAAFAAPSSTAKPRVYWWWFAGEHRVEDIEPQLDWIRDQGLGGALIFFLYPADRDKKAPRHEYLGPEYAGLIRSAKRECDRRGLACDFLFGTGWPFGDTKVEPRDAARTWTAKGLRPMGTYSVSWEWPAKGYVMDHLSLPALERYFRRVAAVFKPALGSGSRTYLECDSWEIGESEPVWTEGFDALFRKAHGYSILPFVSKYVPTEPADRRARKQWPYLSKLYDLKDPAMAEVRYDYYSLVSELVLNNFYRPFTRMANAMGAGTIVECNGTPADIIDAFASVDIPMTEAMLYEPNYSRIPASAARLSGRTLLAAEAFTCLYGWPNKYAMQEQLADLKLVADALFANGTNLLYWHGLPLRTKAAPGAKYYATVHVVPESPMMEGFKSFNRYLEAVSGAMQRGRSESEVAVYLPMEDRWSEGRYTPEEFDRLQPEELRWQFSKYQVRFEHMPKELEGRAMLWINGSYLRAASFDGGRLKAGEAEFKALHMDARYLPYDTLKAVLRLAKRGLPVCLRQDPREPGTRKHADYGRLLEELRSLPNVVDDPRKLALGPALVEGKDPPEFWARRDGRSLYVFFANPAAKGLKYPLRYGQSLQTETVRADVRINAFGGSFPLALEFKPYQSLLVRVDASGPEFLDVRYHPPVPKTAPGPVASAR